MPVKEVVLNLIQKLDKDEYKTGTSDENQDQMLGFRFRMPLGAVPVMMNILQSNKRKVK